MTGLAQLEAEVHVEGNLLAAMLSSDCRGGGVFDELAANGPRSAGSAREYAVILESILEGYLMHYVEPRIFTPPNGDMRLLGGDFLYAFGLARLARLEDLPAISELSDLIALSAQAELRSERSPLVRELWHTVALVVVCGVAEAQADLDSAKSAARIGAGSAERDLAEVAKRLSERHGLEQVDEAFHRELTASLLV